MPNGLGLTARCICAYSQPDTQASSAAQTKITTLYAAVFTPMDSAMPAPLLSARMARPGREFSRLRVASSASSTKAQIRK